MNHVISGDQVGLLMKLLLDFRLVVERGSGVGRSWCRGVMESDGTGIGYWRSEVDDVIQETEVIV